MCQTHILPRMKRMQRCRQRGWSRDVILLRSRCRNRFKVHQRRSQNPKQWGKHMPFDPGPVSWNPSEVLVWEKSCKPPLKQKPSCSAFGHHRATLPVWDTPACVPLPAFASSSLSDTHTHTPQTHARTSRYTQGKVAFPVLLRQHDSYFQVVTCSSERRGRCKVDTKSRFKMLQTIVFLRQIWKKRFKDNYLFHYCKENQSTLQNTIGCIRYG